MNLEFIWSSNYNITLKSMSSGGANEPIITVMSLATTIIYKQSVDKINENKTKQNKTIGSK